MKRTDVDGAQYADVAAEPNETVAQFKRRWVADKRLGIDVSLVSLHWVLKERPGKPTDAEEQAALCKERLLSDPSVTLRSAGVTDGCWLLALFAKGAGASYVVPFLQHMVALVCTQTTHATRCPVLPRSCCDKTLVCRAAGTRRHPASIQGCPPPD